MHDPRVIVALDYDNKDTALAFVDKLDSSLCKLKVGKEMFTLFGPEFVKALVAKGFDVFLDLKFHDIPNTVAKACKAAAELGVWMVNVAALTEKAGLDGIVCSAQEASALREKHSDDFLLVTPGIRPVGADAGDQKRVMTPPDAMKAGVSYLVMGRPITKAEDPIAVLKAVNESING